MMSHLVSVILPVYNTAPWLCKCLDSILAQTYANLEIICVDDGSTDESGSILDGYAVQDSRIKVIHQANAGVSAARNRGLDLATGDVVTFVDSDDYILAETYEKLLLHLNEDTDVICYGIKGVDERGTDVSDAYMELACEGVQNVDEELILQTNGFICNKLFRTSLLKKKEIRFPEGIRYEDAVFVYAAAMQSRQICYVKEKLYCYLQRSDSFTHQEDDESRPLGYCLLLEALYNYMAKCNIVSRWKNLYYRLFMYYFEYPVHSLSGSKQRDVMMKFHRMVLRTGLWKEYHGVYPFDELKRYNRLRALFYWRNATTKLFKIAKWPLLRIEKRTQGNEYHWF